MASSSAHHQQPKLLPNMYGGSMAAPPPTPCAQPSSHQLTTSDNVAADTLSRLLLRLPPRLSLPNRRSTNATCLPTISVSGDSDLLSAATELGFFQLTDHGIPSGLANSAESDSFSLFKITEEQKETYFPRKWPLGYEAGDEEEAEPASFCLDGDCSTESTELSLSSLHQFTRALEKVGLKVVEMLAGAVGFENPFGNDPTRFCSLMWLSEGVHGDEPVVSGWFYPFVVGLQFQITNQKYSLLADSGWVSVSPRVDSVLVTLGDISQVWSNGKLKKVRGGPVACLGEDEESKCLTMSLLLTLPMDAIVSPLLPKPDKENNHEAKDLDEEETHGSNITEGEERREFRSFCFEDYAWRVYHERLLFKDPLDKYRLRS